MPRAAALSLALLALPAAAEAADIDFQLINASTSTLTGFYASPVTVQAWEANMVLKPLPAGTSAQAKFNDPRDVCTYDLKIEFDDSESVIEKAIDLCQISEYTVEDDE